MTRAEAFDAFLVAVDECVIGPDNRARVRKAGIEYAHAVADDATLAVRKAYGLVHEGSMDDASPTA